MSKERAVVYARVSTESEQQQTSIDSQKEHYPQYVKDKGYEFVKLYYDFGLSATSSNRKDFINMLEDAGLKATRGDGNLVTFIVNHEKEPLFDWIITKDHDRFARNLDAVTIVRALRDKEVYIEFENLGFTTKDVDWELRLGLFLTFAQQESLEKSRKLKDSYLKKSKKGKFHMSVNLLGYSRDKETKEYYIVEEQARIVRKIFDYYTEDRIGAYEIGDILNDKGYTTKQGRKWNGNSVNRVLKNEKFKGQVILNRYGKTDITGTNKRVINPINEWIVHNDALPKIVSVEQFDEAQEIMKTRTRSTVKNKGSNRRQVRGKKVVKNVFHNKIFCGKCGSDYIRESATKIKKGEKVREYFYGCRNRRNTQRVAKKCSNRGISHKTLVDELDKIGKKINVLEFGESTLSNEYMALTKKLDNIDSLIDNSNQLKSQINNEINEIDTQINNLFTTLSQGVSETIIKLTQDKIEDLEQEKIKLEAKKSNHSVIQLEQNKKNHIDKYKAIEKLGKKDSYTFDEILNQLYEIKILNGNKVVVTIAVPSLQNADNRRLIYYMFSR